jgi:hypothetical protein
MEQNVARSAIAGKCIELTSEVDCTGRRHCHAGSASGRRGSGLVATPTLPFIDQRRASPKAPATGRDVGDSRRALPVRVAQFIHTLAKTSPLASD